MMLLISRYQRVFIFTLCMTLLGLAGCQHVPPAKKGLTAEQIAVLKEQGFALGDEGWTFGLSGKVLFGSDLEMLNQPSKNVVEGIGKALLGVGIKKVRIDGHSDASGKAGYNEELSLRRANSVSKTLVGVGMNPQDIELRGLGSREPVATNDTTEGRAENRRVAIVVSAQ
ncbi:MAG: cell envelope biosis protein OmpA [Pseudomonas sp.]|jgi:outer membrane protein OmpA-like peptidoglycan-associated protein|uniref:OmpA family protein n=1 Tax=Pseudomonas sp. TaxID=306 RepID=UPI0026128C0C|nr:OmpA family protein [Pseudomonas sp.]MDB6049037.1 cell envelope biosis protein OmpA [Pseudomonas sp.]